MRKPDPHFPRINWTTLIVFLMFLLFLLVASSWVQKLIATAGLVLIAFGGSFEAYENAAAGKSYCPFRKEPVLEPGWRPEQDLLPDACNDHRHDRGNHYFHPASAAHDNAFADMMSSHTLDNGITDFSDSYLACDINPATGYPMIEDSGIDVAGNPYGCDLFRHD